MSSSPRAVIRPGSPGPAPTRWTVTPDRAQLLGDEAGEVRLALLVGGEVRLGPRAQLAQAVRQLGMLRANDGRDLVAEMLGEGGRGAAGRDRDGDRLVAVDGGEDERAELGHVDDVAEERARLGIAEDAAVHRRRGGGGDDEELPVEVGGAIAAADEREPEALPPPAGSAARRR